MSGIQAITHFTLIAILLSGQLLANQTDSVFQQRLFSCNSGSMPYRILFPNEFNITEKYPLIVFLHGAGERGNDNIKQLRYAGDFFFSWVVEKEVKTVVVLPQCSEKDYWAAVNIRSVNGRRIFDFSEWQEPTMSMKCLISLIDSLRHLSWIDTERLYVGGLSMGGMGTFELLARQPDWFAAAFPICGGGNPEMAVNYASKVPLWIFHGEKDEIVPVSHSLMMADAIRKYGGQVKLSVYPSVGHNSWENAFKEPELIPWLLSQRRSANH